MKVFEIIVISCQENKALPNSIEQVAWVCRAAQKRVGRHHHLVSRLPEPGNQRANLSSHAWGANVRLYYSRLRVGLPPPWGDDHREARAVLKAARCGAEVGSSA